MFTNFRVDIYFVPATIKMGKEKYFVDKFSRNKFKTLCPIPSRAPLVVLLFRFYFRKVIAILENRQTEGTVNNKSNYKVWEVEIAVAN